MGLPEAEVTQIVQAHEESLAYNANSDTILNTVLKYPTARVLPLIDIDPCFKRSSPGKNT